MPMPRLLTMVLMLAIMALIFVRLRDPNTWRFFAQDNDDDNRVVAGARAGRQLRKSACGRLRQRLRQLRQGTAADSGKPLRPTRGKVPAAAQQPAMPPPCLTPASETPPRKTRQLLLPELTPTGPTDLDPIEQEDIKRPFRSSATATWK